MSFDNMFCDICHELPENCLCPECDMCGVQGDPACVGVHMPANRWHFRCTECNQDIEFQQILWMTDKITWVNRGATDWRAYCRQCITEIPQEILDKLAKES